MPRVALPIPTSNDAPYNQRAIPSYEAALRQAGAEPVLFGLGANPAQIRELLASCHGVCLPGSPADVDPATYGADRHPSTAPADEARDRVDRLLLEDAQKFSKPVLGICYGVQSLNVWLGGSLVQDVSPVPVNHSASKVAVAHSILIAKDSLLATLADPAELTPEEHPEFLRLAINTSHHQAVAAPGTGLRIVARCPEDGVIEAVELDPEHEMFHVEHPWFLLGVQWHPERSYEISATSRNLFAKLVAEAKVFQANATADA